MLQSVPSPRRGDIWLVALDPTVGHEIRKTRPAVVVTAEVYNQYNWVVLVVPVTSQGSPEYDQVRIQTQEGGLTKASVTLPDQLRAVDRRRLVKRLGRLSEETMRNVDQSLRMVLGLG